MATSPTAPGGNVGEHEWFQSGTGVRCGTGQVTTAQQWDEGVFLGSGKKEQREKQQGGRSSSSRLSEKRLRQRGEEGRKAGRGEEELEKDVDIN